MSHSQISKIIADLEDWLRKRNKGRHNVESPNYCVKRAIERLEGIADYLDGRSTNKSNDAGRDAIAVLSLLESAGFFDKNSKQTDDDQLGVDLNE